MIRPHELEVSVERIDEHDPDLFNSCSILVRSLSFEHCQARIDPLDARLMQGLCKPYANLMQDALLVTGYCISSTFMPYTDEPRLSTPYTMKF